MKEMLMRPSRSCYKILGLELCFKGKQPFTRSLSTSTNPRVDDPRVSKLGKAIEDDFAIIKERYSSPKHPVVLAHGLFGFDELHIASGFLPGVQYWRGVREVLAQNNIEVFTTSVPASASIEERAARLRDQLSSKIQGRSVNIVAHSMGGLDSRYMISNLKPTEFEVKSLTTIATPHRGSSFADYIFERIGDYRLPRIYGAMRSLGLHTEAFNQLTRSYMRDTFNPKTPDHPAVRYFSYGAVLQKPSMFSMFRQPHRIIGREEGPNDGLVSVESSRWGGEKGYKGTLMDVSHLDLINWTNRLRWLLWELTGHRRNFNALAFYLDLCDTLAREGL